MPLKKSPKNNPPIILITGASGAGKSTVVDELFKRQEPVVARFITCTTRAKRSGERHGKDYWFLSVADFKRKIQHHSFYEWANVYGNYYGSAKRELNRALKGKKPVIIVVDIQGAHAIKQAHPEAFSIFIDAPTKELKQRLIDRGCYNDDLKQRLARIATEKRYRPKADLVITNKNGQLERTILKTAEAIRAVQARS